MEFHDFTFSNLPILFHNIARKPTWKYLKYFKEEFEVFNL